MHNITNLQTHENTKADFKVGPISLNISEKTEANAIEVVSPMTDNSITPVMSNGTIWKMFDNNSEENTSHQIIYVSYQDPNNPEGMSTLQEVNHMVGGLNCFFFVVFS